MSVNNFTTPNPARVKELKLMQDGYLAIEIERSAPEIERSAPEYAKDPGKHYNNLLKIKVTKKDLDIGYISLQLDPYLIAKVCKVLGGAMEHILKKALCD